MKLGGGGQKRFSLSPEFDMIFSEIILPSPSSRDEIPPVCMQVVQTGLLAVSDIL
jgi:hypothetical protein